MSDKKEQAFQDLLFLRNRFAGLLALADDLKDISSLEQATKEAGAHFQNVLLNQKDAERKLDVLEEKLKTKREDVAIAISEETAKQQEEHEARLAADLASAKMQASKIIGDAEKEAGRLLSAHTDTLHAVGAAKAELETLKARITERRFEHEGLVEKVAREKTMLADAQAEIETLRKTLGLTNGGSPGGKAE